MKSNSESCGVISTKEDLYLAASDGNLEMVERILKQENGYGSFNSDKLDKSPFLIAVSKGFEDIVRLFLQNGAKVNTRYYDEKTGLHIAADKGNHKMVELLLKNCADVNAVDRGRYSPLLYAVKHDYEEIVRLLMENGAELNISSRYGETGIHIAAGKGNQRMVELLLKNCADVNSVDRFGYSPLLYAVKHDYTEIVRLLMENGAEVNIPFVRDGETALHVAATNGNHKIAKLLLGNVRRPPLFHAYFEHENEARVNFLMEERANVNARSKKGRTALHIAAGKGNLKMVELLLANAAAINAIDRKGSTPLLRAISCECEEIVRFLLENGAEDKQPCRGLHFAVRKSNQKIVELFLENGADVNELDVKECSPIFYAIEYECEELVRLFLEKGVDINTVYYGKTALHFAVGRENWKMVKLLLENGADVNSLDPVGYPAFFHAIKYDTYEFDEIVRLLIEYGVDVNTQFQNGQTALQLAASKGNQKIVELLLENGADESALEQNGVSPLSSASGDECEEIVRLFLEKGFDVNKELHNGLTALHFAACKGDQKMVELLLENGADVNALDRYQRPPLFHAIERESEEIARLFIKSGANVNMRLHRGQTALHLAAFKGNHKMVELLLQNAANMNVFNPKSHTPLYYAIEFENEEVVRLLMKYGAKVDKQFLGHIGKTALHLAARKGNYKIAKLLLGNVRNARVVNALDQNKRCPLFHAIEQDSEEIVKLFLEKGANVNAQFHNGQTALHFAASKGNQKIVELLLEHAADVNALDRKGYTPLFYAVEQENEELVRMYLENGADNSIRFYSNDETVLHFAAKNGIEKMVEQLLECPGDVNALDQYGLSPIFYAIECELWNICKLFSRKCANNKTGTEQYIENIQIKRAEMDNGESNNSEGSCKSSLHTTGENDDFKTQLVDLTIRQVRLESGADLYSIGDIGRFENVTLLELAYVEITTYNRFHNVNPLKLVAIMLNAFESQLSERIVLELRKYVSYPITANVGDLGLFLTHEMAFKKKCEEEMSKIKIEKIGNSKFVWHDMLLKTTHQLAILLENGDLYNTFNSSYFSREFPIYGRAMDSFFRKARRRRKLIVLVKENCCHIFPEKMHDCIPKIFGYLSEMDLLRFWAAF